MTLQKKVNIKSRFGITLISLVITIIILLILSGIAISQIKGKGLLEKAQLAKEETENIQNKEEDILNNYEEKINEQINSSRETIEIDKKEYSELLNRVKELENKMNFNLKAEPVIKVNKKSNSMGASTIWLNNNNSYMTREYNEEYFEYDSENGFVTKKSGLYLITMSSHISVAGNSELNIKVNNIVYCLNRAYTSGSHIGGRTGNITIFLNKDDIINGNFYTGASGSNHYFNCSIYAFN